MGAVALAVVAVGIGMARHAEGWLLLGGCAMFLLGSVGLFQALRGTEDPGLLVDGWRAKTPDGFLLSAKFPRTIVHGGDAKQPDGDKVLVAVMGYFGQRLVDMAGRYRADVVTIERPWGEAFSLDELEQALIRHKPAILAMVHAETSTGVCQPMAGIGDLCRQHNCLLLLDTVTSLGAVPLYLDDWKVDLAYSCSQKGLSCPPGLGPFSMGPRAEAKMMARQGKVPNWYLDVTLLNQYWGSDRVYHHTAPVNMNFGMREALRLLAEEGLEQAWARHRRNAEALWAGLEALGLELHVPAELRLPTLTTVRIPKGVDGKAFTQHLLNRHGIEVGGGLGALGGQVWRIGLMGFNSTPENVTTLLNLFETELPAFRSSAPVVAAVA
jgi:alanine-glyoxylate transaminase/serine-glyoxylate transaminase/serine-pyruvate transaminase